MHGLTPFNLTLSQECFRYALHVGNPIIHFICGVSPTSALGVKLYDF